MDKRLGSNEMRAHGSGVPQVVIDEAKSESRRVFAEAVRAGKTWATAKHYAAQAFWSICNKPMKANQ